MTDSCLCSGTGCLFCSPPPVRERWLPVVGCEGLYEVSDQGRVRSLRTGLVLKPDAHATYPRVTVGGGRRAYVHHLVAAAFIGPRPLGFQVLHRNDVRTDNRVENLYYGTASDNMADSLRNGRRTRSSRRTKPFWTPVTSDTSVTALELDLFGS